MKIFRVLLVSIAVAIVPAQAATLREQLALATKAEDHYAQIELIQRILEKEPTDAALREKLADWWLAIDDYDMAEKVIKEWKDVPESVRASVMASVLYHRDEKPVEAIQTLEAYHAKEPSDVEITRQLSEYLEGMRNNQRIVEMLDTALGLDADLLVTRATARRNLGDWERSLKDFALAERTDKEDLAVRNARDGFARVRAAIGGIKANSSVLIKEPANVPSLLSRSYWYTYTGFASDLAFTDALGALKAMPESATVRLIYAKAANAAGKLSSGDAMTEYGVDVNKGLPSMESLNQLLLADQTLAAKPGDAASLLARSFVLNDAPAQYEMGLRDCQAVLSADPTNTAARVEMIYSLVKLGRRDDAATEFQTLAGSNPKPTQIAIAANYLADAAFSASKFELALEFADRAIVAAPAAQYYKQRAAILQRLNRGAEADADLSKAKSLEKKATR